MKIKTIILIPLLFLFPCISTAGDARIQNEIHLLQHQTAVLQHRLDSLQNKLVKKSVSKKKIKNPDSSIKPKSKSSHPNKQVDVHNSPVTVKSVNGHPESVEYNPVALMADDHVVTYIAGMPIVTSPYLGARPAFDGSDYIVNISSINRDIRLMQQRRRLYDAYDRMGYPHPNLPIVTISGKVEPIGSWHHSRTDAGTGDWNLGSGELDAAAAINDKVEAYIALAYDSSPPNAGGPRVNNSNVNLNMGFINIGDLDESPYYFTAGQLFVPFGRFSTAMVSAPLTMIVGRTKARPVILGYKSQGASGPFAATYAYKSETTLGNSAIGGVNLGYVFNTPDSLGEVGASFISSLDDAAGLQVTRSGVSNTFAGFASVTNGNESVRKIPAIGAHANFGFDRYNLTAEWVSSLGRYRVQDLSFNGRGAQLQAAQLEGGVTFMAFDRPSSVGVGYQWSKDTLALNLPEHRAAVVFNTSIWKDTVESLEYRHDINFKSNQFANGSAPAGFVNANTIGLGGASDTVLAQIGVYF